MDTLVEELKDFGEYRGKEAGKEGVAEDDENEVERVQRSAEPVSRTRGTAVSPIVTSAVYELHPKSLPSNCFIGKFKG
jgi:hypothetical protein